MSGPARSSWIFGCALVEDEDEVEEDPAPDDGPVEVELLWPLLSPLVGPAPEP